VRALAKAIVRGERLRESYSNVDRKRPMVTLTLSREALTRLDALAAEAGQSRSGAVEALVRRASPGKE
jgi:Ribbon-helix-helix protein, copG family